MKQCKITVMHRSFQEDLVRGYSNLPPTHGPCPLFAEGQVFIVGLERPQNFCTGAWNDLYKYIVAAVAGGDFSQLTGVPGESRMLACCTDGMRPVVFELEPV